MINQDEAYLIVKNNHPGEILSSCLDFKSFYLFIFRSIESKSDEEVFSGTEFDAVDKKTNKVFRYDITSDPDAFFNSEEVKVNDGFDVNIEEIGDGNGTS